MIRDIFTYFTGTYKVTVSSLDKARAVKLMYENSLSCTHAKLTMDGDYMFSVTFQTFRTLTRIFNQNCINYSASSIKGFPRVLKFLAKRPGIILGSVVFTVFMLASSRIIWKIDVSGNSTVSDDEIISLLDELGCGYGDYIPNIDFDMLHARFISKSENIAWISVNMKGTHANVEVLEVKAGDPDVHENGVYANIIAGEDAQITLIKTSSGSTAVSAGDIVKKGDLLVSGIIGVREDRIRYEYAEAEIFAYVPRTIEIKIPFENREKSYTGNFYEEKTLKILKNRINLFIKGGIEYTIYDKIIDNRQVMLFDKFPLPIWTETVTYKEYEYTSKSKNYKETVSAAMSELRIELDEILETSELVSNKVSTELTNEYFIIKYDMICLTNIAETCEFTVDSQNQ